MPDVPIKLTVDQRLNDLDFRVATVEQTLDLDLGELITVVAHLLQDVQRLAATILDPVDCEPPF